MTATVLIIAAVGLAALAVAYANMAGAIADRLRLSFQQREEDGTLIGGTASQGALTLDVIPTAADDMTIGSVVYTFVAAVTGDNEIALGALFTDTQDNILGAINGNAGIPGTDYSANLGAHPDVTIAAFAANIAIITAKVPGVAGDLIVTTETFTPATDLFDGATLGITTAGAAPTGDFTRLPITSESLSQVTETVDSLLLRDDRQIRDHIRSGLSGEGDLAYEFIAQVYDTLMKSALQSVEFTEKLADLAVSTIEAIATDTFRSSVDHAFANLAVGSFIRTVGFADPANNGFFRVLTVGDGGGGFNNEITVEGGTLVSEAAGAAVTFEFGEYITNGTRLTKFDFEKEFTDLTAEFEFADGYIPNAFSMDITADAILTGTFGFMGQKAVSAAITAVTGTLTDPPANPVLNAVDDVLSIREGGLPTTNIFEASAFGFVVANNLRPRRVIADVEPESFGSGTFNLTGTLQAFFQSKVILDKYLNFTESELFVFFEDADGKVYIFEIPRIKYDTGLRVAGGQNTDIIADLTWSAFRDDVKGFTLRIHRII